MPWGLVQIYASFPAYLLVLFRVGGLFVAAPLFSSAVIPLRVRILLAMAIAACVFPTVGPQVAVPVTLGTALAGLVGELALGLFIGFCVALVFLGVQVAAEFVSHQAGILLGTVYNPMLDSSESVLSQLYYLTAMVGFLAVGGHRQLVRAVLDSFATLPPLGFRVSEGVVGLLLDMLTVAFETAIRISAPTVLALLLALMALGFLSRTIPQLNILTIGFPLKLCMAFAILALTVMTLEPVLLEAFGGAMEGVRGVLATKFEVRS